MTEVKWFLSLDDIENEEFREYFEDFAELNKIIELCNYTKDQVLKALKWSSAFDFLRKKDDEDSWLCSRISELKQLWIDNQEIEEFIWIKFEVLQLIKDILVEYFEYIFENIEDIEQETNKILLLIENSRDFKITLDNWSEIILFKSTWFKNPLNIYLKLIEVFEKMIDSFPTEEECDLQVIELN